MKAKPFEKLLLQQMEIFDQFDKLSIAGNADAGGQIHPEQTLKVPTLCLAPWQGPASTRYSTRTRNFSSYSNSTRTKHYSDRVVNSRNFRIISTIIQKQPARRYFKIITANPDIQKQPSMEKMSSDLNVTKMSCWGCLFR